MLVTPEEIALIKEKYSYTEKVNLQDLELYKDNTEDYIQYYIVTHEEVSSDLLDYIAFNAPQHILKAIISNSKTNAKTLSKISRKGNQDLNELIAAHSNTDRETIEYIFMNTKTALFNLSKNINTTNEILEDISKSKKGPLSMSALLTLQEKMILRTMLSDSEKEELHVKFEELHEKILPYKKLHNTSILKRL
jgi:hypothetical protein